MGSCSLGCRSSSLGLLASILSFLVVSKPQDYCLPLLVHVWSGHTWLFPFDSFTLKPHLVPALLERLGW